MLPSVSEVRAEWDFIVCSQSRIRDAQPPQGNVEHKDELQAGAAGLPSFLTLWVCVCVCPLVCERRHVCGGDY